MSGRILIIGGYGNFGTYIARRLASEPGVQVIIAGRSFDKASALARSLGAEAAALDISRPFDADLARLRADVLIHTSGPFQEQGYAVAETCIRGGVHYLDLADARAFVAGIGRLDAAARAAGVLVASGVSSVPGLSSAVLAAHAPEFATLDTLDFGISTAQKTNRGLATVRAVLGYAGKPFRTLVDGEWRNVHGWQDLRWHDFRGLGRRPLGNCDIPDLEILPHYFPGLRTIRFQAGLELNLLQLGLWASSWLVRAGLVPNLRLFARPLLHMSDWFNGFGTDEFGFFMQMEGTDSQGRRQRVCFDLTARAGDGLNIPCLPAVVLAIGLATGTVERRGAMPCAGLVPLDALFDEFRRLRIDWGVTRTVLQAGSSSNSISSISAWK